MKPKREDLVIFPFGGNAREAVTAVLAVNAANARWNLLGFVDANPEVRGSSHAGFKVLGGPELLNTSLRRARVLAVPGNPASFAGREAMITKLKISPDRWATVVDPSARVALDASIGKNVLVLAGCFIGASAVIADNCIVLPQTVVQHDAVIEKYAILGSHVTISGACRIGRNSYVASGTRIKDGIKVGSGSLVGLGSVVLKDVPAGIVVVGHPAAPIRRTGRKSK